jgi:hypothetical protein
MAEKLNAERLRGLLAYTAETGLFTWKVRPGPSRGAGERAGVRTAAGYIQIKIDQRCYRAHRLAWLWMTGEWPPAEIDHKNLDKADNRWGNLRSATRGQNQANNYTKNNVGLKGVSRLPDLPGYVRRNPYQAVIVSKGRKQHLGMFATAQEAHEAYAAAARAAHGEFARFDSRN